MQVMDMQQLLTNPSRQDVTAENPAKVHDLLENREASNEPLHLLTNQKGHFILAKL